MAVANTSFGLTWAARLIGAGLLVVLGYLLFRIVIGLTNPESVWTQPSMAPAATGVMTKNDNRTFNFAGDPFNRSAPDQSIEEMPEIGEDAPETTLNLKLTGLITGPNGTATLVTPDNKEAGYRLGDEILSGVTLQAINKDFIVLSVGGEIQRLTFVREKDSALLRKTAEREHPATSRIQSSANNAVQKMSRVAPSNASTAVVAKSDVSTLFQDISLRRVVRKGQVTGYGIRPNRPGLKISDYGFEDGDIVTWIGGTDIRQGRPDFLALLTQAQSQGGADIVVLRNGQERKIRLGAR